MMNIIDRNKTGIMKRAALSCSMLLLLTSIGCNTLNFSDPNAPTVENVGVQNLVTGAEAGMKIDLDFYINVVSIVGREAYLFEGSDPRWGFMLFEAVDPAGPFITRTWTGRYRVIGNCTILLGLAEDIVSTQEKAGIRGFAKTIIAYQLLLNLNMTYNNGIMIVFNEERGTPASRAASFTEIARLLDEGNSDLASAGDSFTFILSPGFAGFDTPSGFAQFNRALRARIAAYTENWQTVLSSLGSSFLDPSGDLNRGVYHVYSTGLGDLNNPIFEDPNGSSVLFRAQPSFETDAEAGDARFSSKVVIRPEFTAPVFGLVSTLAINVAKNSTDKFPIIRNEELILLRAEANIGLGNFSTAEADLNIVRNAAGLGDLTGTNATNGVDRLLYERRYSLFIEGHRWVDMRRYGRLSQLPIDRAGDVVIESQPVPLDELPVPGGN